MSMLLSWRLWRATFRNSLVNFPLLLASPDGAQNSANAASRWLLRPRWRRLIYALMIVVIVFLLLVQPWLLGIGAVATFVTLVVFAGTLSGWLAAQRIAGAILREQEKGRYEMLLLTPPGVLGVHWAIVTRFLRDDPMLRWLRWLPSGFYILIGFPLMGLFMAFLVTSLLWIFSESSVLGMTALFQSATGLVVVAMLYGDYVQSVIIGILVGILLPTYAQRQNENAAYAIASSWFFSLQLCFYLLYGLGGAWVMYFIILPAASQRQYIVVWAITFASLIAMVLLREVVVRWLWRMAEYRLNFDANESGIRA